MTKVKWIYFMLFLFIAVIFFCQLLVKDDKNFTCVEPFTPGLRRIYRPYIRRGRVYATKMYNSLSSKTRILLSKYGII